MKHIAITANNAIEPLRAIAKKFIEPLYDLGIRLYMANIFFNSGWLKFQNHLNDDWSTTVLLFEDIHPIPGISPELAAASATAGELILSILLAIGLFARFGAAGLLVIAATIQFIVPAEYGLQSTTHYFWMFLLASTLIRGPGALSLDKLVMKWITR